MYTTYVAMYHHIIPDNISLCGGLVMMASARYQSWISEQCGVAPDEAQAADLLGIAAEAHEVYEAAEACIDDRHHDESHLQARCVLH